MPTPRLSTTTRVMCHASHVETWRCNRFILPRPTRLVYVYGRARYHLGPDCQVIPTSAASLRLDGWCKTHRMVSTPNTPTQAIVAARG